jgi:hypothetical protein
MIKKKKVVRGMVQLPKRGENKIERGSQKGRKRGRETRKWKGVSIGE